MIRLSGLFVKYHAGKYFETNSDFPCRGGILIINFLIPPKIANNRYFSIART